VVFDPRKAMFMADTFAASSVNDADNGGRFAMVAERADKDFYKAFHNKKQIALYTLRPARQGDTDVFMAYWCPYTNQQTRYTTLTGNADFMFTATMDGCSFGIGSRTPDGTCLVSHSNQNQFETKDSKAEMISKQKGALRGLLGAKAKLFQPKDYRSIGTFKKTHGVSAATFGVCDNRKWKFYSHRFMKKYNGVVVEYDLYDTVAL